MPTPRSVGDDHPPDSSVVAAGPPPGGHDEPSFGRELRQLRVRGGLTREVLAERAGVSVATLAALEGGQRRRPYPHTVVALGEALGVSAAERTQLLELASGGSARPAVHAPEPPPTQVPTRQAGRVRLPVPPTALIGREAEMASASALMDPAGSAVRLLTLTGPGGVGKTRLALAVAAALVDAYSDGVVFVDLARLREQRLVPATIAHALELRQSGGRSARELLLAYVQERQLLLVLDNFEHLLGAAPLLAELLEGCPRLALLVTSRAALRLRGEHRVSVPPLATPAGDGPRLDAIAAASAVRLFVERAQAAAPEFALGVGNAGAVAAICRRLDGMPLSIELAAARAPLLQPEALLRRLDRRLPLLTGGAPDLPLRQQTLRGTLAWSHDLLAPREQLLLRRLAVFAGSWTLAAAEAVCADAELPLDEVLDRLEALVDSSLVQRLATQGGDQRFAMLPTIGEYAEARLAQSHEEHLLRNRHLDWCLALAEAAPPELMDPPHIAHLAQEQDNLRAALRWTIARGEAEAGLRLGVALWPLWYVRGRYAEGRVWLAELLALSEVVPTAVRARALIWLGHLAFCEGDFATAQARLEEALATARGRGAEREVSVALLFLGHIPRIRGDLQRAAELYHEALTINRRLGDAVWEVFMLDNLALLAERRGDAAGAEALGAEALALARAVRHQPAIADMLSLLGRAALGRGESGLARQRLEEAAALQRAEGFHQALAWTAAALAQVALAEGDAARAGGLLAEGLELAREAGDRLMLARGLDGVAALVEPTRPERAVRLAGAAAALRQAFGAEPLPAERARLLAWQAVASRAVGEEAYAAAWAEGSCASTELVIAEALAAADAAAGNVR